MASDQLDSPLFLFDSTKMNRPQKGDGENITGILTASVLSRCSASTGLGGLERAQPLPD